MGADIDDLEDVEDYDLDPGRDVGKKEQTGVPVEGIDLPVDDFDPTEYDLDSGRMVEEDDEEDEDRDDE